MTEAKILSNTDNFCQQIAYFHFSVLFCLWVQTSQIKSLLCLLQLLLLVENGWVRSSIFINFVSIGKIHHLLLYSSDYQDAEYLEENEEREEAFDGDPLNVSHAELSGNDGSGAAGNSGYSDSVAQDVDMALNSIVDYEVEITSNEEESEDDADDGSQSIFTFMGVFCKRLYKSQLRPKEMMKSCVKGNTIDEILKSIWKHASKLTCRQVLFENDVPQWSDKQEPGFEDIEQFVTMQDTAKKRVYAISAITARLLTSWRAKSVKIFVYAYSTNIESAGQYQSVMRKLIAPENPDRAGAHSTRDNSALANELRNSHPHIEGHTSSWLLWANLINSSPGHARERMKQAESPPLELTKYFRWAAVSEAARLQSVHRGMVAAHTVNDSWTREIADVKNDISMALSILQGAMQKMNCMSARGSTNSELLTAMESATRPEETNLSRESASLVTDCEDVDHAAK